jgi:hypothetical protein
MIMTAKEQNNRELRNEYFLSARVRETISYFTYIEKFKRAAVPLFATGLYSNCFMMLK